VPPTAEGSLGFSSVAVSNAIVASARLRDKRILPAAIRVARSSPMNTDAEMRAASAFALGVLSDSPDEQTVGILSDLMAGSMEIEPTHAEAAKALGTLRATEALGSLRSARGSSPEPITRYMAHLAVLRITGKEEPYEPPVVRYQARTSVNIPDER
jgi:hypothetical protein